MKEKFAAEYYYGHLVAFALAQNMFKLPLSRHIFTFWGIVMLEEKMRSCCI